MKSILEQDVNIPSGSGRFAVDLDLHSQQGSGTFGSITDEFGYSSAVAQYSAHLYAKVFAPNQALGGSSMIELLLRRVADDGNGTLNMELGALAILCGPWPR